MTKTLRALGGFALSLSLSACGFGLLQTAKTLPPGSAALTFGGGLVHNEIVEEVREGSGLPFAGFVDLNVRAGLAQQLDMGIGFFGLGGRLDAKYNLVDSKERLALSPRIGTGYLAMGHSSIFTAHVGGLASYDVTPWFTPYGGVSFANYWTSHTPDLPPKLGPNERLVDRSGYGDGMVQLQAGAAFGVAGGSQVFVEYGRAIPAQNDLGDNYSFVASNVFVLGFQKSLFGW